VPHRPPTICYVAGCANPANETGRCDFHTAQRRADADRGREEQPQRRGFRSSRRWREIRAGILAARTVCECGRDCCPRGCRRASVVVDHISDRRVELAAGRDPERPGNLQALAKRCHDRKTARTVGLGGAHT
jgi:5-methylcytosine-specific restriction endonuclease McrA